MNPRLLRLLSVTALVTASLSLLQTEAGAQQYQTVSGQFTGRPTCRPGATGANQEYNCAARASDNSVFGFTFTDVFLPPSNISPVVELSDIRFDPACFCVSETRFETERNPTCTEEVAVTTETNTMICAGVGADNSLVAIVSSRTNFDFISGNGRQNTYLNLGGQIAGDPSCVLTGSSGGNIWATCAAVDRNNHLVAIRFNAGGATPWQALGGTIVDNPSCVAAKGGFNQVICAVKGTDNSLFGIRFGPQTGYTSGFKSLGGKFVGSPSCANTGSGTATCAIRDVNNALVAVRFSMTAKSAFQNLGGTWVGDPSCAPANEGFNRVICVGRATENYIEAIRLNPSTGFSSGFQSVPGRFTSDPGCAHRAAVRHDDGIFCAARDMNNALAVFFVNP